MIKTTVLATVLAFVLAAPALAGHCPADAKAIDHALSVLTVADDVRAQIIALKDEALALHSSGTHANAEDLLSEAMRLLLNAVT
ncbi:MAG: hypothetical protein ACU0DI_06825 [Paracoccaceae bacterium]